MLQPVENTIKDFFDRFGVQAMKIDNESAARLLASEIYLHHMHEDTAKTAAKTTAKTAAPITGLAEAAVIAPKRRGRPQGVNASKKARGAAKGKGAI